MNDFWPASGFVRLERDAHGWLVPTDAYLRSFLALPQLAPPDEACDAERRLHEALQAAPADRVAPAAIEAVSDADARDNLRAFVAFRDGLLAAGTLEAYYLSLMRNGVGRLAPFFVECVVQAIVRNVLDGGSDAFERRAGELLFRTQRVSVADGRVLLADREAVDARRGSDAPGAPFELAGWLERLAASSSDLPVLGSANAGAYLASADGHGFVLDLTHEIRTEVSHGLRFTMQSATSGQAALARVLARWVRHLLDVAVTITPLPRIDDPAWTWHVGLDVEASALLNDLYEGATVEPARLERLSALFRLEFDDPAEMLERVAGRPVYLGLGMSAERVSKLKPQNLLLNLPLARTE